MLRTKQRILWAACTFLSVSLALCANAAPGPGVSETPIPSLQGNCAAAAPDATYFIPEKFGEKGLPSGSGAYGYRNGCPLWIGQFSMNSKSNTSVNEYGQRVKLNTAFDGQPFDLPSSLPAEGSRNPIVGEDCNRLQVEYFIYTKMNHEPSFKFRKRVLWKGHWNDSSKTCQRVYVKPTTDANDAYFYVKAPDANVLVIRVAVRVKLRSSWQEAQAWAGQGPPE